MWLYLVGCRSGQNATGHNATNVEICFYFLLMLFQFVALGFKARNAGKCEHPIRRLVLSALPLHFSNEAFTLFTFHEEMTTSYARLDLFATGSTLFRPFSHFPKACVHLITELIESVRSKPWNPLGTGLHACCKNSEGRLTSSVAVNVPQLSVCHA